MSDLKTMDAQIDALVGKMRTASENEMADLERRVGEIQDERCRAMGFSEAEIAEINAKAQKIASSHISLWR